MAELIQFDKAEPIIRGDGIESVLLTPSPLEHQGFIMGITSFPPGTAIPLHSHNTIEQVSVVEGEGTAELNGEQRPARPFDTTQIAPGEVHRFINTGDSIMRILWVYGSTHVTRTFAESGETVEQFDHRPPTGS